MTVIVGVAHEGRVILGGDRARTIFDDQVVATGVPKVWSVGEIVIGQAGDERQFQVLRRGLDVPDVPEDEDVAAWVGGPFVDVVRSRLREAGALGEDEGLDSGPRLLVGVRGRLFLIDNAFAAIEFGEWAIGSGGGYALGALHAVHGLGLDPAERVGRAMQAAAALHPQVRGPFDLVLGGEAVTANEHGPEVMAAEMAA